MFEIIEKENEHGTIIKVFGVGGAGGNAIQHMIEEATPGPRSTKEADWKSMRGGILLWNSC